MSWFEELFGIKQEVKAIRIKPKGKRIGNKQTYSVEVSYDGNSWTPAPDGFRYRIYVGLAPEKHPPFHILTGSDLQRVLIEATQPGHGPEFSVTFPNDKRKHIVWVSHLNSNIE